jgi:hypothetical protein
VSCGAFVDVDIAITSASALVDVDVAVALGSTLAGIEAVNEVIQPNWDAAPDATCPLFCSGSPSSRYFLFECFSDGLDDPGRFMLLAILAVGDPMEASMVDCGGGLGSISPRRDPLSPEKKSYRVKIHEKTDLLVPETPLPPLTLSSFVSFIWSLSFAFALPFCFLLRLLFGTYDSFVRMF